jgi:Uma2 family endonuclease
MRDNPAPTVNAIYEEIIHGETLVRSAPGTRHEKICAFLHEQISAGLAPNAPMRLLPPRSVVQLAAGVMLRPDLALVTATTGKIWLAAEIVDSNDHKPDTVLKKSLYEDFSLPRLWMIDPRYNNVEFYHGTPYGLALKGIMAGRERFQEPLLPEFKLTIDELFAV